MDKLLKILENICPGVDFKENNDLIESGILDSLAIISLATDISDEFDIDVTVRDILPENFSSVAAIVKMIERLQDEG
ncbi:MAG TPA: phosphopantetheine-binding protein [Clostridiales bacterium]|nr:phosphopantetheine-binding protein [Clostridiales bacterium]